MRASTFDFDTSKPVAAFGVGVTMGADPRVVGIFAATAVEPAGADVSGEVTSAGNGGGTASEAAAGAADPRCAGQATAVTIPAASEHTTRAVATFEERLDRSACLAFGRTKTSLRADGMIGAYRAYTETADERVKDMSKR